MRFAQVMPQSWQYVLKSWKLQSIPEQLPHPFSKFTTFLSSPVVNTECHIIAGLLAAGGLCIKYLFQANNDHNNNVTRCQALLYDQSALI